MAAGPNHLWGVRAASKEPRESDYDNVGLNNLSPVKSVENNESHPMNIYPNVNLRTEKPLKRRKSLYKYQKDLEPIQRQIHELLAKEDKPSNKDSTQASAERVERQTSETDLKRVYSAASENPSSHGGENDIYHTRIQEGDNNLMFVCEPKTMKSCCKQIGDNNVMVNLHMSMITNCCQMLYEDTGKVFQLDSEGEVWLEIKVRRNKSSDRLSNCSTLSSDSNTSLGGHSSSVPSPASGNSSRTPTEHSDISGRSPSLTCREFMPHLNNLSGTATDMFGHTVEEYHRSGNIIEEYHRSGEEGEDNSEFKDSVADNVTVYEKNGAIFVQMETPERLSDYSNLEECQTVQEALGRQKVKDFLKNQANNSDFDVSIIGWEYEREPLYSITTVPYINEEVECPMYSEAQSVIRTPTLPPRRHKPRPVHTVDISPLLTPQDTTRTGSGKRNEGTSSIKQLNTLYERTSQAGAATPPTVPPRAPEENSERPHLMSSLSYEDMSPPPVQAPPPPLSNMLDCLPPKLPAKPKSPGVLPAPPPFPGKQNKEQTILAPWYHGKIGNDDTKTLLFGMAAGSFLVRDASDSSGDHKFTLEFVDGDAVRRLKIMKIRGKYHLKDSEMNFVTVEELVEEAMKTGIEVRGDRNSTDWRMIKIKPVKKT